jgi:hypothetical protein
MKDIGSKAVSASSEEARNASHKALIHQWDLQEVFCKSAIVDIIVISLADTAYHVEVKADRTNPVKHTQRMNMAPKETEQQA